MKVNGYTIHPIALGPHGPMAQITQHAHSEANDRLLIADMATTDEAAHTPAASVQIFGRPALLSLRDKLVEIYPLPAPESQYGWLADQRDALLEAVIRLSAQCERLRLPGQPESDAETSARDARAKCTGAAA